MVERDRDSAGRARSARPRDAMGRPLPRGSEGVRGAPEDIVLEPDATLTEAQRLIDSGHPFHAHEVLEAAWKSAPESERDLWRGLAQLAVGLTHGQRGNAKGAVALLRRGTERVQPYAEAAPYEIDVGGLLAEASTLADRIESAGLDAVSEADLRLRLAGSRA